MIFEIKGIKYEFDKDTNSVTILQNGKEWKFKKDYRPKFTAQIGKDENIHTFYFDMAEKINSEYYSTSISEGVRTDYKYWKKGKSTVRMVIRTLMWVHKSSGRLYFELIPVSEPSNLKVQFVFWPAPFEWVRTDSQAYTLFPHSYGMMIPSDLEHTVAMIADFPEEFLAVRANMNWYAQVDHRRGWQAIIETPWDCNFSYHHPKTGSPTDLFIYWSKSFDKIKYRRILRMEFFEDCDYVDLCKAYRNYIKTQGEFYTLKQKAELVPKINDLVGSPIIHSVAYYNIKPEAFIYNKEKPEENYKLVSFDRRADQIKALARKGLKKAYLHLDGWGRDGYDREHPDVLPPCEKCGGAPAMKRLADACHDNNVLFVIHDQYRDYYYDCKTFDKNNAVRNTDGTYHYECTWNGGDQTFLCEQLAPYYVERNYDGLEDMGIKLDGAYLDVFSCTFQDECDNPEHRQSKKECVENRNKCLSILAARGMIMSSETVVDCFIKNMVLCHYFTAFDEDEPLRCGIRVPLFNLCYHDCIMVPFVMHGWNEVGVKEDRWLEAILNADPAYLEIDADETEIEKISIVSELQSRLAFCEMVSHEFLSDDYALQRTKYSDGTEITVDFGKQTYSIKYGK